MNGVALSEHREWRPWKFIVEGNRVAQTRITPLRTLHATIGGRLSLYTVEIMVSVVETTKALNKMMGHDEYEGAVA